MAILKLIIWDIFSLQYKYLKSALLYPYQTLFDFTVLQYSRYTESTQSKNVIIYWKICLLCSIKMSLTDLHWTEYVK